MSNIDRPYFFLLWSFVLWTIFCVYKGKEASIRIVIFLYFFEDITKQDFYLTCRYLYWEMIDSKKCILFFVQYFVLSL